MHLTGLSLRENQSYLRDRPAGNANRSAASQRWFMTGCVRLLLALFVAVPGFIFTAISFFVFKNEYFWFTYVATSVVFVIASLAISVTFPYKLVDHLVHNLWIQLFTQGVLAWLVALLLLAILNSTPLCIGQNNGDGVNNFILCAFQTIGIAIIYTPLELILLALSVTTGALMIHAKAGS